MWLSFWWQPVLCSDVLPHRAGILPPSEVWRASCWVCWCFSRWPFSFAWGAHQPAHTAHILLNIDSCVWLKLSLIWDGVVSCLRASKKEEKEAGKGGFCSLFPSSGHLPDLRDMYRYLALWWQHPRAGQEECSAHSQGSLQILTVFVVVQIELCLLLEIKPLSFNRTGLCLLGDNLYIF